MTAEDHVRALLEELQEAVTTRDLDRLVGVFTEDGVVFGTNSNNFGLDELRTYAAGVLAAERTPIWSWDRLVVLEEGADRILFAVVGRTGVGERTTERFRATGLAVLVEDRWRFRHYHGSVPDPLY